MRSGLYQNITESAFAFWKNRRLQWVFGFWVVLLLCGLDVRGQAPNLISFQGVARNENGQIRSNDLVALAFRIHSVTADGPIVGSEINVTATTNSSGIFNHMIGSKTLKLELVDWTKGPYYLEVLINSPETGDFVSIGTTQITSIPYAFHAREAAKLADNVAIVLRGTFGTGEVLPEINAGTRSIWYPRKGAFRAGTVSGNQWEDFQIGNNSFAAGLDVLALGAQSIALGNGLVSKANGGVVLGTFNNQSDSPNDGGTDRIFQLGNGSASDNGSRSNALTVLKNGRVGVGNLAVAPGYLLDVAGRMRIQHQNGETAGIHLNTSANTLGSFIGMKANDQVGLFIGGDWRFWVNAQGNGYLNGNIIQTSDRRLKRDFSPVKNSLSKLTNITGQHYFWKDSTKSQELQTGLIAQEVEQYFPELVTTDEKGFKAVNYIGLIPHLIESVKALKAQTETIGALEKKLESFTARETQMRDEVATVLRELRSELSNIKSANNSKQQSK